MSSCASRFCPEPPNDVAVVKYASPFPTLESLHDGPVLRVKKLCFPHLVNGATRSLFKTRDSPLRSVSSTQRRTLRTVFLPPMTFSPFASQCTARTHLDRRTTYLIAQHHPAIPLIQTINAQGQRAMFLIYTVLHQALA